MGKNKKASFFSPKARSFFVSFYRFAIAPPLNDTLEQAIESADSQFNLFISPVPKSIY